MKNILNIKNLLEKRNNTPLRIRDFCDFWLQEITQTNSDYVFYIDIATFAQKRENRECATILFNKYYLYAIFDLANFIPRTNIKLNLYIFTKEKPLKVKISQYNENLNLFGYTRIDDDLLPLPEHYTQTYEKYIKELELWINDNIKPQDFKPYEFNEINYIDLDINNLLPRRYSKEYFKIKDLLKKESTIKLGDIANIIKPNLIDSNEVGKFLKSTNFQYPLNYKNLQSRPITNIKLQKGDILVKPMQGIQIYLIDEEPEEPLYVNVNWYVLKVKEDISPEYLYLYLNSDTCQLLMNSLSIGSSISLLPVSKMKDIPVIVPKKDRQYYKTLFKMQAYSNADIKDIKKFIANNTISTPKTAEDAFNREVITKVTYLCNDTISKILEEDMKEINTCYRAKAYKATLILCGSVLEAFLLDWLHELQPEENWLEKQTYINKNGEIRLVGLDYYINKVAKITKPQWMKEMKDNAFTIKDKRNLVHAKLCLKEDVQINDKICKDVISYLKEIIMER